MCHTCVIEVHESLNIYLFLIEFSYNNSYRTFIEMPPFKALYGRKFRLPLHWIRLEKDILGPKMVQEVKNAAELIK